MSFVLALDQGTTSSRAILFDQECRPRFVAQREFTQHFPRPGWVEHDPEEIWASQVAVAAEAVRNAGIGRESIAAIGITNQRETTVVWNRSTGVPVGPAIVWQDRRTAEACDRLRASGAGDPVRAKTGLVLDAYFSATKIAWLLDHVEGARDQAERGELAFGTVDTWLAFRLTDGRCHVTDPSNAARTMLYDIHAGAWDDELLALFGVPRSMLPEVRPSSGVLAEASAVPELEGVPIAGIAGDQQAALFGQRCTTTGSTKCTYGTGCFLLMNTGATAAPSTHKLLTTVAWGLEDRLTYALEGSVFIGGAVVQWLRDGLGIIETAADVERLAVSVEDSDGVYLVPAFAGLGAPHWNPHARGTIVGITRGTTAAHLARAALEAIAYQVADLLDAMRDDAGTPIPELRVDGGAAANDTLMQFQANLLGIPVARPEVTETTALGAAMLAGLATGFWRDADELASDRPLDRRFEPAGDAVATAARRARWSDAVGRSLDWAASS